MPPCDDGICQVHSTFEKSLLTAVEGGTKRLESVLTGMFSDLNRRLDESLADRVRMHQRIDGLEAKIAAVGGQVEAIIRQGHPLRRSDDGSEEGEPEKKAEGSWLRRNWWAVVLAALAGERVLSEIPKAIKVLAGIGQ